MNIDRKVLPLNCQGSKHFYILTKQTDRHHEN